MVAKRLFDVVVAAIALAVLAAPMLLIASAIRLCLGRPILFVQQRPGLGGKPFRLFKFRSMADRSDAAGHPLPDEERLQPLGQLLRKASLDELPELWNVLKGDMSIVGPRPLLMEYLPLYNERQARRHEVRPGVTGLAQVRGRNALSWTERFEWDVWYVEHRSFLLDLKILWLTFWVVLRGRGVSQDGHATAEPFRGND